MKKILIVEDDFASQLMLEIMIEDFCKFPFVATNGMDAVSLCKDNPDINIVLMDIRMTELNGYDATKKIREFNKNMIIIAQTSLGFPEDRENSIAAGCNDYISKPYSQNDLAEMLKKWTQDIKV
jgi:CheY-like chemotaxis protein